MEQTGATLTCNLISLFNEVLLWRKSSSELNYRLVTNRKVHNAQRLNLLPLFELGEKITGFLFVEPSGLKPWEETKQPQLYFVQNRAFWFGGVQLRKNWAPLNKHPFIGPSTIRLHRWDRHSNTILTGKHQVTSMAKVCHWWWQVLTGLNASKGKNENNLIGCGQLNGRTVSVQWSNVILLTLILVISKVTSKLDTSEKFFNLSWVPSLERIR